MKKIELKEKMIEKNMIKMTNGEDWFLNNPFGIDYPCFIKGNYEIVNFENLKRDYEIISWIIEGQGQEVEGVIYYFQVPVLKQV
jgi:hypothetical protein